MQFWQLHLDGVLTLDPRATHQAKHRLVRLIAGNPVTMGEMTRHIADAGSYAPVTVLIQELVPQPGTTYSTVSSLCAPGHKSDPDLRENRVSDGTAAAAASGLTCWAWVLLNCGPPLAGGLVTGHGSSSDVADSRERAPQAPGAAARSDGAPGWRRSYRRRCSVL